MQDKNFETTRQLLFDGESALKSKQVQAQIRKRFNIKIHAEPYWKRSFAERAILEVKLRMAIHLDMEGKTPPFTFLSHDLYICVFRPRVEQMEGSYSVCG